MEDLVHVKPLSDFLRVKPSGLVETNKKRSTSSYMYVNYSVYRNEKLWDVMRKKTELYYYLRTWIVRGKVKGDRSKLNLLENYFNGGYLAAAIPINKLAKNLGLGKDTVSKHLKIMNEYGIIRIETIDAENSWDKRQHNIYVFGTHDFNKNETYYIDTTLL